MARYQVSANGTLFGTYDADSPQHARDLCAQDAGFRDEADMANQTEQPSELVAIAVAAPAAGAGMPSTGPATPSRH